jgi:hypothetical protein
MFNASVDAFEKVHHVFALDVLRTTLSNNGEGVKSTLKLEYLLA